MPGGRLSPAAIPENLSLTVVSTLRSASLNAATTRSSSISLSSPMSDGSMSSDCTSCLHVIVIFTRPPPDSPVTVIRAISSCAFCISACICWACFINCPIPPFIALLPRCRTLETDAFTVNGLDRIRVQLCSEHVPEGLDVRVCLERLARRFQPFIRTPGLLLSWRLAFACGRSYADFDLQRLPEFCGKRIGDCLLSRTRAQGLGTAVESQVHSILAAAKPRAVCREQFARSAQPQCLDNLSPVCRLLHLGEVTPRPRRLHYRELTGFWRSGCRRPWPRWRR